MNTSHHSAPAPLCDDPSDNETGVLLSDQIEYYAREHNLIQPFSSEALRPAGYCLHVGEEFMIAGRRYHFGDRSRKDFTIQPYEVAVIRIAEEICLPRFLIARWNIRVKLAYKGLMWVGGAQVDPGFKGHLYCPIYNLSDRPVQLKQGERLAVIDFVKTTSFGRRSLKYPTEQDSNRDFSDYGADQLKSALIEQVDAIEDVKTRVETAETRVGLVATVIIAALGVLMTAEFIEVSKLNWTVVLMVLGLAAVFSMSRTLLLHTIGKVRWLQRSLDVEADVLLRIRRTWAWCFFGLALAVFGTFLYILFLHPFSVLPDRTKRLEERLMRLEGTVEHMFQHKKEATTRQSQGLDSK